MGEALWLDDQQQQAWRAYLHATQLVSAELERQLQQDAGLSHPDYEVLVRLSEAPERRLRMSDLSQSTAFSRSRLSHAVNRLEREGLVERESCPADRRGTYAVLTEKGFSLLDEAARGHVRAVRSNLVEALAPAEFLELGRLCAKVRDHLLAGGISLAG